MGPEKKTKKASTGKHLKRQSVKLTAENETVTIIASELANGKSRTQAIWKRGPSGDEKTKDGKPKAPPAQRGMIEFHSTFDAALARHAQLVSQAKDLGWQAKEKKEKAPAFTSLPTAPKPKAQPIAPIRKTA